MDLNFLLMVRAVGVGSLLLLVFTKRGGWHGGGTRYVRRRPVDLTVSRFRF